MSDIQWEDPPADAVTKTPSQYQALADGLRANPGKWAVVKEGGPPKSGGVTASQIRAGKIAAFKDGNFEAVHKDGRVWARLVPDAE